MSAQEPLIFEVSESSFNTSVVLNSYKLPVLVEFMEVWSAPCIEMSEHLAKLAIEFAGQFIFAKVDLGEQAALKEQYSIENVPTLKVFKDGEVVRTEEGQLQKAELVDILKGYGIYNQADELRELARQKHMAGETVEAVNLLTRAIQAAPGNTRVAMDMVQIFLDINELEQAKSLYNRLPDSALQSDTGKSLLGQLAFRGLAAKTAGKDSLLAQLAVNANDQDCLFDLAVCYVAEHDYKSAMDKLFAIFEQNPDYKAGAAKEMIITLTNMLVVNEPALAQEFRRRMGNAIN